MLAARITLPHFSVSSAVCLPNSPGVIGIGVLGALLGGWSWAVLFGSGPTTFLGSVIVGELGHLCTDIAQDYVT